MWLFTQHGYFSVIADGEDRAYVLVRARAVEHLVNLVKTFEVDACIQHSRAAVYPFQVRIKRQRWLSLAQDLAADVRYTNFENAVAKHADRALPRFVRLVYRVGGMVAEGMEPLRRVK